MLGVLNGKKYHADLYVRQVIHILILFKQECVLEITLGQIRECFQGDNRKADLYQPGFTELQIKIHMSWVVFLVKFCHFKYVRSPLMSRELFVYYFLLICVLAQQRWDLFPLTWPEYQTQPKCSGGVAFLWHRSSRDSSSSSGRGQAQTLLSGAVIVDTFDSCALPTKKGVV